MDGMIKLDMRSIKKLPIIAGAVLLLSVLTVNSVAAPAWTETQTKVHDIAEIARSIGLAEDDPIIQRASQIWWEEERAKPTEPVKAEPKLTLIGTMYITGYDDCVQCCGKWAGGPTASGVMPTVNHTVAMSSDYPFGTRIYIEGLGYYTVEDRGVGSGVVDVFCNNHAECYAITGYYEVYLAEEGE